MYGHFKIKIENMLLRLPKKQIVIVGFQWSLARTALEYKNIKQQIKHTESIEIFPNLIMNVALDTKLTQQIHYIINRNKHGIFHLGSTDLVHHDDYIKELLSLISYAKNHLKTCLYDK